MELRRSGFFLSHLNEANQWNWAHWGAWIGPFRSQQKKPWKCFNAKAVLGKYLFGKMAFENFLHGNAWVTMFEKWTKKLIPPNIFFQILEVILRIWFPLCGDLVWKRAKISFKVAVGRRKKADVFHKSGFEDILAGGSRCWWIFYTFYWSCRRQQWQRHIQRLSNKLFTEYFTLLYLLFPSRRWKDTRKSLNQIVNDENLRVFLQWKCFLKTCMNLLSVNWLCMITFPDHCWLPELFQLLILLHFRSMRSMSMFCICKESAWAFLFLCSSFPITSCFGFGRWDQHQLFASAKN